MQNTAVVSGLDTILQPNELQKYCEHTKHPQTMEEREMLERLTTVRYIIFPGTFYVRYVYIYILF